MFRSCEDRWRVWGHGSWRLVLFVAVAALILGLEQWLETQWLPSAAAALGTGQLQANDAVAESLRTFEWARQALPIVAWALVALAGCVVFVPLPRRWLRWLRRALA